MSVERLPCGCKIGVVEDAFVIEPCDLQCPNYLYAIAETKRQAKPVSYIVDPEVTDFQPPS